MSVDEQVVVTVTNKGWLMAKNLKTGLNVFILMSYFGYLINLIYMSYVGFCCIFVSRLNI